MHEMAIISDLMDICNDYAKKHNAKTITKIELDIGRLSGVEPHYLNECFMAFQSQDEMFNKTSLDITISDVIIKCNKCEKNSTLKQNEFKCEHCQSIDFVVISGEEMIIKTIHMQ